MSHQTYALLKPSGVDWLGQLPEHWNVRRLKHVARFWNSNVDKVPADEEIPVRLLNYTDVYYNEQLHPGMELRGGSRKLNSGDKWILCSNRA